jgi:hypothetical protein
METWELYKFLRYVKKQTKTMDVKELDIKNGFKSKTGQNDRQVNQITERAFERHYTYYRDNNLYLTYDGYLFIEWGLYGFLNELITRKGRPITWIAGAITLIDIVYHVWRWIK